LKSIDLGALRILSVVAVLAAILVFAWKAPEHQNISNYARTGEFVIHGFQAPDEEHLPIASVLGAWLVQWDLPTYLQAAGGALLLAFLVLAVEGELESGISAWTAAAAVVLLPWEFPQYFLTLIVLMVAGLLVWRCHKESLFRTFVLSLSIGTSLLFRSTLAFLPPLLIMFDCVPRLRAARRLAWVNVLIFLLVPYIFLLPRIYSNWAIYHRIIPFEDGEASCNIVTGALGVVGTIEGPWQELIKNEASVSSTSLTNGAVLIWALKEIAVHPLRYVFSYLTRAGLAILWCSPYFFFALWALWRERQRRDFQALGLLCAYLLAIHCFMSIQRNYFQPLLPLLLVLCASLTRHFYRKSFLSAPGSLLILAGSLLCMLALSSYSFIRLHAPALSSRLLNSALQRDPHDAWLRTQRGTMRLSLGDISGAAKDLSLASALNPNDSKANTLLAEVSLFKGDYKRALIVLPLASRSSAIDVLEAHLIRSGALNKTDRTAALEEMREAWHEWQRNILVRAVQNDQAKNVLATLMKASATNFITRSNDLLQIWPIRDRHAMTSLLVELLPQAPLAWMSRADTLMRVGKQSESIKALIHASELDPDYDQHIQIAQEYLKLDQPMLALRELEPLAADADALIAKAGTFARLNQGSSALSTLSGIDRTRINPEQHLRIAEIYSELGKPQLLNQELRFLPENSDVLIKMSDVYAQLGRTSLSLSALARAETAATTLEQNLSIARAYSNQGKPDLALKLLNSLAPNADILIEKARIHQRAGRTADAQSELATALALGSEEPHEYEIALIYQDMGKYPRALDILQALLKNDPDNPELLNTRGICKYLDGSPEEAVAVLRNDVRLNPQFLPAYMTLGAIYAAQKRYPEMLKLYESALARTRDFQSMAIRRKLAQDYRWLKKTKLGN
jgi:tetratricopeptide (TPR) repeat protein